MNFTIRTLDHVSSAYSGLYAFHRTEKGPKALMKNRMNVLYQKPMHRQNGAHSFLVVSTPM